MDYFLLEQLSRICGVCGHEEIVSEFIIHQTKQDADEVYKDAIGNLIVVKKGYGENKKKILCISHMDEVGICVTQILDSGLVEFKRFGYINPSSLYMNKIEFQNGIIGIITTKFNYDKSKPIEIDDLLIDIGTTSKETTEQYVKAGDIAAFKNSYVKQNDIIITKALDDRLGCYILVELIKSLTRTYNDIYFVFSTQEEIGLIGSTVVSERINADLGICIDTVNTHCESPLRIGEGIAIKLSDQCTIFDRDLIELMKKCANQNSIKYQLEVMSFGGTDAHAVNSSNKGVKVGGISVPIKYGHSENSIVNINDISFCIDFLKAFLDQEFKFCNYEKIK